ncbi:GTP 3',8-cyclase MoaA [Apibacter muscae]|uniref:GTP 3',8-cyclase MoaA n=1 Tax=Apibacter muscae TaxID=2509004 RepID=UPI0011AC741D|nr:GTP 3',8-cyclase MoaA [Apibacter muscae]TWP23771.1 GTP 3',8-cyclase MoaA [Apibacter muscae]
MNNLTDTFGRKHSYLRISLTDSCNFRCIYCMPEENIHCLPSKEQLQADEIFEISKIFVDYGVNKIRLTGGEPLVRHDFATIVEKISQLPVQIALTTNGVLLDKYESVLKDTNVLTINVSLDSLNPEIFFKLTKRDAFHKVWRNLLTFIENGFHIKLNVVVMKGINEIEVNDFVNLTMKYPIEVRFIEFMPFDGNHWNKKNVVSMSEMLSSIAEKHRFNKIQDQVFDTTKKYKLEGAKGTFAFITTVSQPFCEGCNRMRLTSDGKMKNCLFGKEEFDLLGAYRNKQDIKPLIEKCIYKKHEKVGGQLNQLKEFDPDQLINRSMIKIGG